MAIEDMAAELDLALSVLPNPWAILELSSKSPRKVGTLPVFAVSYTYAATPDELNEIRPLHREWLAELLEKGQLLASGPMVDNPEALLIFVWESASELAELLDNDPFDIAGFIGSRSIQQWNPVFGPFSSFS